MTRRELESLFGPDEHRRFQQALVIARKERSDLDRKISRKSTVETSLSVDEVLYLCTLVRPPLNPLQMEIVRESYVSHDVTYIQKKSPWVDGTEKFLGALKKYPSLRRCANCAYLHGRTLMGHGTRLHPWCAFYKRYLHRMTVKLKNRERVVDMFKDVCPSHVKGDVKLFERVN